MYKIGVFFVIEICCWFVIKNCIVLYLFVFLMHKSSKSSKKVMKILHKIARYTKEQKAFVLYLIVLTVFMLFFPIVKIAPVESLKPDFVFVFG